MAYTAYERADGYCLDEVETLCRHLTNGGTFNTGSTPTLAQVESYITDIYDEINVRLLNYGYSGDQTASAAVSVLQHYNSLGAAARVELSQPTVGYKAGENTRYDRLYTEYEKLDKLIQGAAFGRLGAIRGFPLSAGLTVGGASISDKDVIEGDPDFEKYIFTKDLHKHPGITSGTSE